MVRHLPRSWRKNVSVIALAPTADSVVSYAFKGVLRSEYRLLQQSRADQRRVEKRSKRCTETDLSYKQTRCYRPCRGPSTRRSLHTCPSSSRKAPKRKDQLLDQPLQQRAKGCGSSQQACSLILLLKNVTAKSMYIRHMRFQLVSSGTV